MSFMRRNGKKEGTSTWNEMEGKAHCNEAFRLAGRENGEQ